MAEGFVVPDSLDYILECSICAEQFTSKGRNVPRILPCTHTFCEKCLEELQRNTEDCDVVECPECKQKHPVKQGAKTFLENRYVLPIIKRRKDYKVELCDKHKRAISFFCGNPECQKSICPLCLTNEHKKHNFVDLQELREGKYKILSENIGFMKECLQSNKEKILEKKKELNESLEKCVVQLKIEKEMKIKAVTKYLTNRYDDLLKTVRDHRDNENKKISEDVQAIEEKLKQLDSTEAELDPETFSLEDVNTQLAVVTDITAQVQNNLAGSRTFKHFQYKETETSVEDVEKLCGELNETLHEIHIFEAVNKEQETENQQDTEDTATVKLECTVSPAIQTTYMNLWGMRALNNGTVFLWGPMNSEKDNRYKLTQCHSDTGVELWSLVIKDRPTGACLVRLVNKHCLVISYANKHILEFREANDLRRVAVSHYTAGHEPGALCAASATTLLYLDLSKTSHPVQWLDCSSKPPQHLQNVTHLHHNGVVDICHLKSAEGRNFVVVVGSDGVTATNLESGKCEWNINGFLPEMKLTMDPRGVAVDSNHDRIFVCDHNNSCVQMFPADGEYLGALLKKGEQGIGKPGWISWRMSTSSLIVAYSNNGQWQISNVTVTVL